MEIQNGLALHANVEVEHWEGYLSCKGASEERGALGPHWDSLDQILVLRIEVFTKFDYENQWRF